MLDIVKKLPFEVRSKIYEIYITEQTKINYKKIIDSINNHILCCFDCNRFIMCLCSKCLFSSKFDKPLWTRFFVCDSCEEKGVMDLYEFIENDDQEEMFIFDPNYSDEDIDDTDVIELNNDNLIF